jgi:hypothetical protein
MSQDEQFPRERQSELRTKCEERLIALKALRLDYEEEAQDIAKFMQPSRSRFLSNSTSKRSDKGERAKRREWNKRLLDTYGLKTMNILANGMTSGLTSASRPWFALKFNDEEAMERPQSRQWLSEVERRMYGFLSGTNFYGAARTGYAELGLFGTEACLAMEHRERGMVCHTFTFGEYWIASGTAREPDVLYRHCPLTVREAIHTFGDKVSKNVRDLYDKSQYTDIVNYYQAIEPDSDYTGKFGSFPWRSVYWDADESRQTITTVSGFMEQPFWAPRWDIASGETYGVSPAMNALPVVRELQLQVKRRNEIIDQLAKPEKIVPPSVRLTGQPGRTVSASGITKENIVIPYVPQHQILDELRQERMKLEIEIDALTHADLFNAITNMQGIQPRNVEEIAARNEEKLTQLGPVIERVSNEKLKIIIERTYGIMLRREMLPPVPEELSEMPIKIEFVSILAQMQRMVGISSLERSSAFIGNLAGVAPEALDKLNVDELINEYVERAGAPPRILRSQEEVEQIRADRAEQQQMAQMAEMAPAMKQGAEAARLLSEADAAGSAAPLPAELPI